MALVPVPEGAAHEAPSDDEDPATPELTREGADALMEEAATYHTYHGGDLLIPGAYAYPHWCI
jgi:hypothetical protein